MADSQVSVVTDDTAQLLERANRLLADWELEGATRVYQDVVAHDPGCRLAVNRLGYCFALQGHVKKLIDVCLSWQEYLTQNDQEELASAVAQAILEYDPNSVDARICLLHNMQENEGDEQYFSALIDTVNYFVDNGDGDQALKVLKDAEESFPDNVNIIIKLADVQMGEGDITDSIKSYQRAVHRLENSGDVMRAAEVYRRMEVLMPSDSAIIMRLATIYLEHEKYHEASIEYRNALRVQYNDRAALRGLGISLMHLKDYNGAMLAFRKALTSDPDAGNGAGYDDLDIRESLASCYIAMGNIEDAVKDLLGVGSSLMVREDYDDAQRVYNSVLEIVPTNQVAVRELSNIKDALNRKKAREEQIRKLQSIGMAAIKKDASVKAPSAPASAPSKATTTPEVVNTSLEDDLYGPDPWEVAVDKATNLAKETSEQAENKEVSESASEANNEVLEELEFKRIIASLEQEGLYSPVPFVMAKYPEMIPVVQNQIEDAPSQEVFGWKYLVRIVRQSQEQEEQSETQTTDGTEEVARVDEFGAVRSAFGDSAGSSLFGSQSLADGVSGEKAQITGGHRRPRWGGEGGGMFGATFGGGYSRRGSSDSQQSLVDRIRQTQKGQ